MGPVQIVLGLIENFFLYIPPFIVVLAVIVFIHELGHFLVARYFGVGITTFSIGFGPEIFGRVDRHGTRWRVACIPLGGYVKFIDDDNVASVPTAGGQLASDAEKPANSELYHSKPVFQRMAIVAAGPLANFILAILVFGGLFFSYGEYLAPAKIDKIAPDGAAAAAGFKVGDHIVEIDGSPVESFEDVQNIVYFNADRLLSFVVERDGTRVALKATPKRSEFKDRFGNIYPVGLIGVTGETREDERIHKTYGVTGAVGRAAGETWRIVDRTMSLLWNIVIGKESVSQLGGPIAVAEASGQVATLGLDKFIYFIAVISVGIGLFNLFPIPILDGGNLLFYAIEAIWQRPLSERTQAIGFRIGLAILGMLMVFVMTKDFLKAIGKFLAS